MYILRNPRKTMNPFIWGKIRETRFKQIISDETRRKMPKSRKQRYQLKRDNIMNNEVIE